MSRVFDEGAMKMNIEICMLLEQKLRNAGRIVRIDVSPTIMNPTDFTPRKIIFINGEKTDIRWSPQTSKNLEKYKEKTEEEFLDMIINSVIAYFDKKIKSDPT